MSRGMANTVVELAVVEYLCRYGSVGIFRLVDDVLKIPGVRKALGLNAPPAPGSDGWWRAYSVIIEVVRALEAEGLAKYLPSVGVVNWTAGGCE